MVFTLLAIFSSIAFAANPLDNFLASGTVNPETCAVLVMDLSNNKVLYSHNAKKPLVPASINKAVTIASLLEKSGIDYVYETKVYALGPIEDGILKGNLLVVGGGDPALGAIKEPKGTDILGEIVDALRTRGVKTIQGTIEIDQSIFPGPAVHPSWPKGDLPYDYGTGVHGLNYQGNVSGKSSVADPSAKFLTNLRSALSKAGIRLEGRKGMAQEAKTLLLNHKSPTIDDIMRSCMQRSDNMYAETFMRTLAMLNGKPAATDEGTAIEREFWTSKGIPMELVTIIDGSGLSRNNRLTADFMSRVLKYMSKNADYASFFPLVGQEGTVTSFLKGTPLEGYLALKTGSMNGVQCYAGYKLDSKYTPTHVVVVMVNGFKSTRQSLKNAIGKMFLEIFKEN